MQNKKKRIYRTYILQMSTGNLLYLPSVIYRMVKGFQLPVCLEALSPLWDNITKELTAIIYVASPLIFYSWWLNSSESLDNFACRKQVCN